MFWLNPFLDWSSTYPPQQEIWEYIRNVALKHDLYRKIKFNQRVVSLEWNNILLHWRAIVLNIKTNETQIFLFDIM